MLEGPLTCETSQSCPEGGLEAVILECQLSETSYNWRAVLIFFVAACEMAFCWEEFVVVLVLVLVLVLSSLDSIAAPEVVGEGGRLVLVAKALR